MHYRQRPGNLYRSGPRVQMEAMEDNNNSKRPMERITGISVMACNRYSAPNPPNGSSRDSKG